MKTARGFCEIETEDGVGLIFWKHEEQNRFIPPFVEDFLEALLHLEKDPSIRAVVVSARSEKYFSTGLDLDFLKDRGTEDTEVLRGFLCRINEMLLRITAFPKPLVAAINGHAVGLGCIIPACMDYRLMTKDRGFVRLPAVRIGLAPWPGMLAICREIMPAAAFRDMLYKGEAFTSLQAREMGYIDELCSRDRLLARAVELARELGASDLKTFAILKEHIRRRVLDTMRNEDPKAIEGFLKSPAAKKESS